VTENGAGVGTTHGDQEENNELPQQLLMMRCGEQKNFDQSGDSGCQGDRRYEVNAPPTQTNAIMIALAK
jgi:hypothetical protein